MKCPPGQLTATFDQLFEADCIQTGSDLHNSVHAAKKAHGMMFELLMQTTRNNPCDGCPVMETKGNRCGAFKLYHTSQAAAQKARMMGNDNYLGVPVKALARELNISVNEVRRRRVAGTLVIPDGLADQYRK